MPSLLQLLSLVALGLTVVAAAGKAPLWSAVFVLVVIVLFRVW